MKFVSLDFNFHKQMMLCGLCLALGELLGKVCGYVRRTSDQPATISLQRQGIISKTESNRNHIDILNRVGRYTEHDVVGGLIFPKHIHRRTQSEPRKILGSLMQLKIRYAQSRAMNNSKLLSLANNRDQNTPRKTEGGQEIPAAINTKNIGEIEKNGDGDVSVKSKRYHQPHQHASIVGRPFRLTSGTHFNLYLGTEGLVIGFKLDSSPSVDLYFETLETDLVMIRGAWNGRYLGMDRQGWLISLDKPDRCRCVFVREYTESHSSRFWWLDSCRRRSDGKGEKWYVGIGKKGFTLRGPRTSSSKSSTHFQIRYD